MKNNFTEEQRAKVAEKVSLIVEDLKSNYTATENKVIAAGIQYELSQHYTNKLNESSVNFQQSKKDYEDYTGEVYEEPITTT
ncbi:hypothetical protein [Tenacibaculum sp. 190524A05c]|uniref:hypothetical protein n=1 Tax=Tenacibaculum platacis TaxID=3137852 RepID=UPI0031FA9B8B